jgi:hypothetical protein
MIFNISNTPKILFLLAAFFLLASIISGEYLYEIFTSYLVLIVLFDLFYRENQAPVVVAALGFQWLSITISHFYLVFSDSTQFDLIWRPAYSLSKIEEAYWLSIIGLMAFALGFKMSAGTVNMQLTSNNLLKQYDTFKIILVYIVFSITFDPLSDFLRFKIPAIFQALKTLVFFKWSLFFLMIYVAFKKKEYRRLVVLVLSVEILLSMTGYFAEFASFLLLFPIVYLSFNKITGFKQITTVVLIVFLLVNFGAIWSYIKVEYRPFLSEGERAQVVKVSKKEALEKLWELTLELDKRKYDAGLEALVKRIYALEYFSATIKNIPFQRPYMAGDNWNKSLEHIFMPRMFFPNKQDIDDSKQTYLLTGIRVADAQEGTSISTGYMAESYADFGPEFMHLAILVLGLALGFIFRLLLRGNLNELWGFALVFPMFFLLNINGKSLIKIFGDTVYFFMVFYFLKRFAVPYIDRLMKANHEEHSDRKD